MDREKKINQLSDLYRAWLSNQTNDTIDCEFDYAIWSPEALHYDTPTKASKGKKAKKVAKKLLPKTSKKSGVKKLPNKRTRPIGKSPRSYEELMDMLPLPEKTYVGVKFFNNKPLLGQSKTKRTVGRGQPGRSVLDAVPRKMGKGKTRGVPRIHDAKARAKWVREAKNQGVINNKV